MNFTFSDYQESADFLRGKLNGFVPEALLVLGSGLGFLGDTVENPVFVDYGTIPHFRRPPGRCRRLWRRISRLRFPDREQLRA